MHRKPLDRKDLAASGVVAAVMIWCFHATTRVVAPQWDAITYVSIAEHGWLSNPDLIAPFAYRPGVPLLAKWLSAALNLSVLEAFSILAHAGVLITLMLSFIIGRMFTEKTSRALICQCAFGLYFFNARQPIGFPTMVDIEANALALFATWALLQGKRVFALAISLLGVAFFKELLIVPAVVSIFFLGESAWRRRRATDIISIVGAVTALLVAVLIPRLMLPVTSSVQSVDPLNEPHAWRRVLELATDWRRWFNLTFALGAFWMAPLMLATAPKLAGAFRNVSRDERIVLGVQIAFTSGLALIGGGNIATFVTYMGAAQVVVLALLIEQRPRAYELVVMFLGLIAFNRVFEASVVPADGLDAYIDFFGGHGSRITRAVGWRASVLAGFVLTAVAFRAIASRQSTPRF